MDDLISRAATIDTLPSAQPKLEQNTPSEQGENDKLGVKTGKTCTDTISRQAAIDALGGNVIVTSRESAQAVMDYIRECADRIRSLPSAQSEPISEEYAKAVECWLMTYQIKCAELRGRYTPYEILGWIVSDWRKENEIWRFNRQTDGD